MKRWNAGQGTGALLLVAVLCGCEKEVPRNDYFPLRDGNRWEYRLLDRPLLQRLAEGQVINTAPAASMDGEEEAQDEVPGLVAPVPVEEATGPAALQTTARRVELELLGEVDQLTYRARYDTSEQVWSKRNGYVGFQNTRGRNYLLILPPHTGYRWAVTTPGGQDLFYEIETASATLTTPAGIFEHCALVRQESRDRKEIFRYWFAPDVGLLRRSKFFAGEEVFRQELIAYAVKPATPQARLAEDREVRKAMEGGQRGREFRARESGAEDQGRWRGLTPPDFDEPDDKIQKHSRPR